MYVNTHAKCSIIKPPVRATLEEVRISIGILQGAIYTVRNAFPVGQRFGVSRLNRRALGGVKSPEL